MPACLNDSAKYYTGKENNPRGRGYSASSEKEGKRMKGRDGKMYYVKRGRWRTVSGSGKKRLSSPRALFSSENKNSDFFYRYSRYTIYCDIDENEVQINYISKSPFGERIALPELDDFIKEKIIQDLSQRIKKSNISVKKKNALRQLRTEIRKSDIF